MSQNNIMNLEYGTNRPSYEELKEIYNKYFTLSYLGL